LRYYISKEENTTSLLLKKFDVHTTEVNGVRGLVLFISHVLKPRVLIGWVLFASSGMRATWWSRCGLLDAFTGSVR
jgi:hypothetical protein